MPIDDIRVRLDIPHQDLGKLSISRNGKKGDRTKRIKEWGVADHSIRVRSVKSATKLVMEGSFNGFLNGQTVIGTTDLKVLVKLGVDKVLAQLGIKPTRSQQRMIDEGRIKIERLDFVGYLRVDHLGGAKAVLRALDIGLAGSGRNRMIFPRETVVYHSCSSYWSLMFYDKAQHLRSKNPELWARLDPRIKDVARRYLRVELRQFGKELAAQGWHEVRNVDLDAMKALFSERLVSLLNDLRRPYPQLDPKANRPSRALLLGLLACLGVDLISTLEERTQRRVRKELRDRFSVDPRSDNRVPRKFRRTLDELLDEPAFPIRHGAPRRLRKRGLAGP